MVKSAYLIVFIGLFVFVGFVMLYFGSWGLTVFGAPPFLVLCGAIYLTTRRCGVVRAGFPALISAIILVIVEAVLYSTWLRPFIPGQDKYEPNLVFIFAPQYLLLASF